MPMAFYLQLKVESNAPTAIFGIMQHKANTIKLAVDAAGGRVPVAESFGISAWTVDYWVRHRIVPPQYIRRLADLGGNIVTVERLLEFIEQSRAKEAA